MSELERVLAQPPKYTAPSLIFLLSILSSHLKTEQKTQLLLPKPADSETTQLDHPETESPTEGHEGKLSAPENKSAPEYVPIPDNGDKLIMVLNFLLREVVPLPSKEAQKQLLTYYFRAILSESLFSPFTSLAYTITTDGDGDIKLHDDIYQIRPDVSAVCRSAIHHARTEAERQRYTLESQQFQELITTLHVLLTSGYPPQAILEKIANSDQAAHNHDEKILFNSFGWIQAEELITVDVAQKLNLPSIKTSCYAGKKVAYIMPQSEIHAGDMSVVVIAQPVYIPSIQRFVLLHDQSFFATSWSSHIATLLKLGVAVDPEIIKISKKKHLVAEEKRKMESYIMSQVVTLEDQQATPAKVTLSKLLNKQSPLISAKEWWKKIRIKQMDASLDKYADLVLAVLEEERLGDTVKPKTVQSLTLFIKRIVLAGILTESQINNNQVAELVTLYKQHGHKTEQEFARTAALGFNFGAAVRTIDTSLLECVSIGTIQGFGLNRVLAQLNNDPLSVSRDTLANVIGAERAMKWREHQTCIQCGTNNTWVGECGLCLKCETAPQLNNQPKSDLPKPRNRPTYATKNNVPRVEQTISVSNLIAGWL